MRLKSRQYFLSKHLTVVSKSGEKRFMFKGATLNVKYILGGIILALTSNNGINGRKIWNVRLRRKRLT